MEQIDNQWLRALTAHAPEMVIQLAARLTESWQVSYEAVPQTGLSLLQLQDSVLHEPYYLGEIPLSTAWVKLKIGNGQSGNHIDSPRNRAPVENTVRCCPAYRLFTARL